MDSSSQADASQTTGTTSRGKRKPSKPLPNPGIKPVNSMPDMICQDVDTASQAPKHAVNLDIIISRQVKQHLDTAFSQIVQSALLPLQQMLQVRDRKISKLSNDLHVAMTKIEERHELINQYQHKIGQLSAQIHELKSDNERNTTAMSVLKAENLEQHDKAEQYSRRECLRISGLNVQPNQSTDEAICKLAKLLGVTILESDISRSHFTNKDRSQMIVKFVSYRKRSELITARNKLKNITDLGRVYINEDLTKIRYQLFSEMLKLKQDEKVYGTWTFDGNIFYKISEGGDRKQIFRHSDIIHLKTD